MWREDGFTIVLWKHSVCTLLRPEIYFQGWIEVLRLFAISFVFFQIDINCACNVQTNRLSRKFSHIRGQWTTISQRGFCMAWQLFLSLFLPFIVHYPPLFLLCPQWERVEMLKTWWFTARSPHSQLPFSRQLNWKEKLESGVKACIFLKELCFMRHCHSRHCWMGCSQCADS